jgi:hypothetical protein
MENKNTVEEIEIYENKKKWTDWILYDMYKYII